MPPSSPCFLRRSGRIPLNLLSPFPCTGFCFVFRSPHRVSSDTDLAQRRIRTSCVYVTHLILWSDFSVRLSTIPVTVTTNSSFSIRRSLDAGATSFSGRSNVRSLLGEFRSLVSMRRRVNLVSPAFGAATASGCVGGVL